jgi:hypothetical protein
MPIGIFWRFDAPLEDTGEYYGLSEPPADRSAAFFKLSLPAYYTAQGLANPPSRARAAGQRWRLADSPPCRTDEPAADFFAVFIVVLLFPGNSINNSRR